MIFTVLKLGGELLEDAAAIHGIVPPILRLAKDGPLVVVHGGGRAIDAELRARGEEPRFVDGLRVTDAAALDAVVCVLAGRNNTALVAAIGAAGGRAVGLTGADGFVGRAALADTFTTVSGERVNLGLVGHPDDPDVSLLHDLGRLGYIPVVASVGMNAAGDLLNVNADVLAGHLAASLGARRLIVAGATKGVLREDGQTIAHVTPEDIDRMTASGAAHSGMIAKLGACRHALEHGVTEVAIVSGRGVSDFDDAPGTRIELPATLRLRPERGAKPPSESEAGVGPREH